VSVRSAMSPPPLQVSAGERTPLRYVGAKWDPFERDLRKSAAWLERLPLPTGAPGAPIPHRSAAGSRSDQQHKRATRDHHGGKIGEGRPATEVACGNLFGEADLRIERSPSMASAILAITFAAVFWLKDKCIEYRASKDPYACRR